MITIRPLLLAVLSLSFCAAPAIGAPGNVDLPRFPSVSPDGSEVVFSWRGDLWKVPVAGGRALRLTSHEADELHSAWSPDGAQIAFTSSRSGPSNLYVMNADGTNVRQVTSEDNGLALSGFSADGRSLLFSARREGDVYRNARPYRVPLDGGPIERLFDAYGANPVMSPDGRRIAFVRGSSAWWRAHYRGADDRDVWVYSVEDDSFTRITSWEGNDGMPRWKDNETLVFASDREDRAVNLYSIRIGQDEEDARRLTQFEEGLDVLSFGVSRDGSTCVLHSWDTLYSMDLERGAPRPAPIAITASEDEADNFKLESIDADVSEAALSPDGQTLAAVAYGEIYIRNIKEDSPTRRIEMGESREREIAWSPDGLRLYFVSDESGTDSIYAATVALTRAEITEQAAELAGEDEAELVHAEEAKEEADEEEADPALDPERWHDAVRFNVEPVVVTEFNDRDPAPSPDGTKLAFRRTRGDIMILDLETSEVAPLVEHWDFRTHFAWHPNSRAIAYAQYDMDYNMDVWLAPIDDPASAVNISQHPDEEYAPAFSADGRILTFISNRIDDEADVWMVYLDKDLEGLSEIDLKKYYEEAVEAATARTPLPVPGTGEDEESNGGNADDREGNDEEDGDGDGDEDEKDDGEEDTKEVDVATLEELELSDAYLRLRRVTSLIGNESELAITPGGDRYVFTASDAVGEDADNSRSTFSIKWDRSERTRLGDNMDVEQVSLTGDKVLVISSGHAATIPPEGGELETLGISDKLHVDLEEQSIQKFKEMSRILGVGFYNLKGLDWDAITERYLPLARAARTSEEFAYVGKRFIGRLAGSHLNVYPPSKEKPNVQPNGRLGIDAEPVQGGFRVTRVLGRSPAASGPMALRVGDVITAVEMEPIDPDETLAEALKGRIGQETIITVRRQTEEGEREVHLIHEPFSYGREVDIRYEDWQRRNAELVDQWSNGRIGYHHIRAMGITSLYEFERDLYAAAHGKDGLLIDVRNNGGGWTTDLVLGSIMTRAHAYTIPRGADRDDTGHYPQGRLYIQRYTNPVNMLCNEKSYSNAEIISHAFKTLERGTLVGQETNGSVISTGGSSLIDGTWVRLPFRGWYLLDGTDMEETGAVPHIIVEQTPEDEARDHDAQLKAAVDDLLKRID